MDVLLLTVLEGKMAFSFWSSLGVDSGGEFWQWTGWIWGAFVQTCREAWKELVY
jgi:hypothetical protein